MNFAPPAWVKEAGEEALNAVASNHYSHPKGRMRLREAIKNYYGPKFDRELDVESEILVTSGANEGNVLLVAEIVRPIHELLQASILCSLPFWSKETRSSCLSPSSISISLL